MVVNSVPKPMIKLTYKKSAHCGMVERVAETSPIYLQLHQLSWSYNRAGSYCDAWE